MEVKRICRVLMVIFLALGILFFALYRTELERRTVISEELVMSSVDNLKSRGIEIEPSVIERNKPERDIYYFEIGNKAHFDTVVEKISSSVFESGITMTEFDTPEGLSIGIYDSNSVDKELGRIVLYDAGLNFSFSKNGVDMSYGDKPILNMQTESIDKSVYDCIDRISSSLTSSSNLSYSITGSSANDSILIVTAMQTIDGNLIKDVYLNYVFVENELAILSGNWITASPKAMYHNTLTDGVNVLFNLDLEKVKSIERQEIVYTLGMSDNGRYFILPRWEIVYTDKSDNLLTAYFDAL